MKRLGYAAVQKRLHNLMSSLSRSQRLVLFAAGFGLIGAVLVFSGFAAGQWESLEPEDGSRSGSVSLVDASGASGGRYVMFGSSAITLSITSPAAGGTVSGTFDMTISYGGNARNIEILNGNTMVARATLNNGTATASINSTTLPNGQVTLLARAWDSLPGTAFTQTADSPSVTYTVQNNTTTPPPPPTQTTPPRQPVVNVKDFGARGDGSTDDTGAIIAAMESLANGGTVYFPAGTYLRGSFEVYKSNVHLWTDAAAVLKGNNDPDDQNIYFNGAHGSGMYGLTVTSPFVNHERMLPDGGGRNRISIWNSDDVTIRGNTVIGSPLMGITINGGSDRTRIENNTVRDTGSDGIHFASTSSGHYVGGNTIIEAGDDCVAVVSERSSGLVSNTIVENNSCSNWWARGYTVVGGENVTVQNNTVDGSVAAGIYIGCESNPAWATLPATNVKILNNRITNAVRGGTSGHPYGASADGHSSILILNYYGGGTACATNRNILVAGNTIDSQVMGNEYIRVDDNGTQEVNIIGNIINGNKTPIVMNMSASQYNLKNNLYNGSLLSNQINNPGIIPSGY